MKIFIRKIGATPRRREGPLRHRGPPRHRHLLLDEPGDSEDRHSGSPRRSVAHLGEPLCRGRGRLA